MGEYDELMSFMRDIEYFYDWLAKLAEDRGFTSDDLDDVQPHIED